MPAPSGQTAGLPAHRLHGCAALALPLLWLDSEAVYAEVLKPIRPAAKSLARQSPPWMAWTAICCVSTNDFKT